MLVQYPKNLSIVVESGNMLETRLLFPKIFLLNCMGSFRAEITDAAAKRKNSISADICFLCLDDLIFC